MNLNSIPSVISLSELPDGPSLLNSPVGQLPGTSGLEAALASHSAVQEINSETPTNATSGPPCLISSASAALSASLGNRLQTRLARVGSTEYRQIWKEQVTPAGRRYWEHTASAHRISDKGSTGLLKKTSTSGSESSTRTSAFTKSGMKITSNLFAPSVQGSTEGGGWAKNACAPDLLKTDSSLKSVTASPTPAGWVTPNSRDWKDTAGQKTHALNPDGSPRVRIDQAPRQAFQLIGTTTRPHISPEERPVAYNAEHSRWLMGFPPAWSSCADTETLSCPRSLLSSCEPTLAEAISALTEALNRRRAVFYTTIG